MTEIYIDLRYQGNEHEDIVLSELKERLPDEWEIINICVKEPATDKSVRQKEEKWVKVKPKKLNKDEKTALIKQIHQKGYLHISDVNSNDLPKLKKLCKDKLIVAVKPEGFYLFFVITTKGAKFANIKYDEKNGDARTKVCT